MNASEFVNTMAFGMLKGTESKCTQMSDVYDNKLFFIPRIYCKDGFNISVQVHHGNYCTSENGTRAFGLDWKEVEWGFPSKDIDGKKYNAEDKENTTNSVGGWVDINLINALCEEHGGIDLAKTLQEEFTLKSLRTHRNKTLLQIALSISL